MSNKDQNLLTPEKLFQSTSLRKSAPSQLSFARNGQSIAYLAGRPEQSNILDLWRYDTASREHQLWVSANDLIDDVSDDVTALTMAERAERERRRQFTLGIQQYQWLGNNGQVLVVADGAAYSTAPYLTAPTLTAPANAAAALEGPSIVLLTPGGSRNSGFNPSLSGSLLSYVRDGDLYFRHLDQDAAEFRVTEDGSDTLTNGLPDFLAAEEMHRFNGAWWSPCEGYLIYCKNDESGVAASQRLEIDGDGSRSIDQRYPFVGATNPQISLHVFDLERGTSRLIWSSEDNYLARVNTNKNGVCIQVQDRLQQQLDLLFLAYTEEHWQTLHTERSDTWINLTDDLRCIDSNRWLFTTEKNGQRSAMILENGQPPFALPGPVHINCLLEHTDSIVYACGWNESPAENHLFAINLDATACQQVSSQPGWHEFTLDPGNGAYLDRWTNEATPLQIELKWLDQKNGPEHTLFSEQIDAQHPYHPFLNRHSNASFGTVEAEDGQTLHYRLTPPSKVTGKHPVIVYVYGGPGVHRVKREWSPLLVQLFAHHGYGVLELDNRGSSNRGRHFERPLYRSMGTIEVNDQLTGLSVLEQVAWADSERIGVHGHSYGGYMTLMCLCKGEGRFKAGVAVAPVTDWTLYDSHYTERFMGLPNENPNGYLQGNVMQCVDDLRAPLLLMHGMADDNVLLTHSTLLMSALQRAQKAYELMLYPGAKHSMQEPHVNIHRFNLLLDFFQRHL